MYSVFMDIGFDNVKCNPHLTIQRYIDLSHGTDKEIISLMAQEVPDGTRYPDVGNAVATTWIVSITQIRQADLSACKRYVLYCKGNKLFIYCNVYVLYTSLMQAM
jgi:hypothetical protein